MDLGNLDLTPRLRGNRPKPLTVDFVRSLRGEDLDLLHAPRPVSSIAPLQRISDRHRKLASMIATGSSLTVAALHCGYTTNRVSILMQDPSFLELVEFYRTDADRISRTNFERMTGLAATSTDIIQDRMETAPDDISMGQLIEIAKLGADRSGLGPQSSSVTLNINLGLAEKMKRAREAARSASAPLEIEGTVLDITPKAAAE